MKRFDCETLKISVDSLFKKYYFLDIDIDKYLFIRFVDIFKFDYNRYFPGYIVLEKVYERIELVGILLYRLAREFFLGNNETSANHLSNLGRVISGFEIYYTAVIGKGLKINHGLGSVIGARVCIGENATIHQNVTLGDKKGGRPILLNNVIVFAGAVVLGKITIGNNSTIGANCVCLIDVCANQVIIGIPGKIKK
jgi:serine O-acetyltransferase